MVYKSSANHFFWFLIRYLALGRVSPMHPAKKIEAGAGSEIFDLN